MATSQAPLAQKEIEALTQPVADEKSSIVHANSHDHDDPRRPSDEELKTLRRVPGKIPMVAYILCIVEFAERGSFYGVKQVFANFVMRPLPEDGNGAGAPPRGLQGTAGALGKGTEISAAVTNSFGLLVYALPILGGWLADTRWGRFKTICIGVAICGISHVLMVIAAIPSLIQSGQAFAPFMISVYVLAIGAALFKPCVSVTLMDQNPHNKPTLHTNEKTGEKEIIDPEVTTERMMLWFYLLINIGGFMGVPTSYLAKYVGFWAAFLLPGIIYFLLPLLLWAIYPHLTLYPPGGSDLGNVFRVLGICFRRGGLKRFGRHGFWEPAKPSVIQASFYPVEVPWDDVFVNDVRRTFQACGIFLFIPIFSINDGGLGGASDALSVMLTTNGVPNDVINNFNSLVIILGIPIFQYGIYPALRHYHIHYGSVARMFTGMMIGAIGSIGWAIITHFAYTTGPCGDTASSLTCVDADKHNLVSPVSIWWTAIPVSVTAIGEILVNVTAYGIAYSRSPVNMRGLVSAINLFMSAIQYAINLATVPLIRDPFIPWAFAGPSIVGFVSAWVFWFTFKHLDVEEYEVSQKQAQVLHAKKVVDEEAPGNDKVLQAGDEKHGRHQVVTQ